MTQKKVHAMKGPAKGSTETLSKDLRISNSAFNFNFSVDVSPMVLTMSKA